MTNHRLRTSIHAAGLTLQELSERLEVDPKTIERWISKDRLPHRINRQEVARALHRDEDYLWPDAFDTTEATAAAEAEVVKIYASRGEVPSRTWVSLIEASEESIDMLAFAGSFLHDAVPGFIQLLAERASAGVKVRLLFGDPDSLAVAIRGSEEGIGESLAARCALTWKYLAPLQDLDGVEMRSHSSTLYTSMFKFDDDLIANNHLLGTPASQAPTMHLRRIPPSPLFDNYVGALDTAWRKSKRHAGHHEPTSGHNRPPALHSPVNNGPASRMSSPPQ